MKQRTVLLTLLLLGLCMLLPSAPLAAPGGRITWHSLEEGVGLARAEKKAMIIDFFYNMDCPRCAKLQKEVYDDPAIAKKIMADFIPIRIDLTKKLSKEEEALGAAYDYKNDCLLIFLDYNRNLIKDQTGKKLCFVDKIDADEFIRYLDHIKKTYYQTP